MQTWTIGKKLLLGVGAMFALALLMGGAGLLAARSLNNQLAQVGRHDAAASSQAAHIQYLVANLSVLTRQTVIAAARNQGAEVAAKITETNAQLAELRAARQRLDQLAGDSDVTRLSRSIDQSMVQWERKAEEAQKFAQAFSTVEAIEAIDASKSFSDSADKAAGEIVDVLRRRMDANIQSASTSYGVTFAVLVVMAIAVIAVGALVIYSVRSTVSNLVALAARLRRRSDHVQAASGTVSASSQSLSRGATTQAASLEETSASI
jgi:CHASE3 domain sensor protein